MAEVQLLKNNHRITSVFSLLGDKENDLTFSLAWIFSQNNEFLSWFLSKVIGDKIKYQKVDVTLQRYDGKNGGYTDIEFEVDDDWFIIVEAKKGLNLPNRNQIRKYLKRKKDYPSHFKTRFVVLSDWPHEYVIKEINQYHLIEKVVPISWEQIFSEISKIYKKSNNYQKQLIRELEEYLKEVILMDNIESNRVFCVALSKEKAVGDARISYLDIVKKKRMYFYNVGKKWPTPPPNYIAFRTDGKLLSIHYVIKYDIVDNLHKYIPEIPNRKYDPLYLLWLDKPFGPAEVRKNGNIYVSGHVWFELDTIFTSKTIKDAQEKTRKREG